MTDTDYMRMALELAERGMGWTSPNPMVGAVIVKDGRVIGQGWHARCGELHAERSALKNCGEDPAGATMYVTLEPCAMCAGAALLARVDAIVFGAFDPVAGCCGSVLDLTDGVLQRTVRCIGGVQEAACARLLQAYFQNRRMG